MPAVVAFEEGGGVAEIGEFGFAGVFGALDEAEVEDGHVAVGMDGDVVGVVGGGGFAGGGSAEAFHDVGFADGDAGGAGVEDVVGEEIIEDAGVGAGDGGEKIAEESGDLGGSVRLGGRRGLRRNTGEKERDTGEYEAQKHACGSE